MRGSSIELRRSLRTRVGAASLTALLAVSTVVCVMLPHGYRLQQRAALNARAGALAEALSSRIALAEGEVPFALPGDGEMSAWATAHPALDVVVLQDADGGEVDRWPDRALPRAGQADPRIVAARPLRPDSPGGGPVLVVRLSTAAVRAELTQVRWLFGSIFLLLCGVFAVLARYFTTSILGPFEDIGRAAQCLADGEPSVQLPQTGDREIDELGDIIARLGQSRHRSAIMPAPKDVQARMGLRTSARDRLDDTSDGDDRDRTGTATSMGRM